MLKKDLLKIGTKIVVGGSKSLALGAGVSVLSQSVKLIQSGDAKFGKNLLDALDITVDTLIK